ncbi:MAG: hypothetical protein GF317_10060 [Candidatus Lokiarchaeota archaeon]|nr:hypothetical protein [Candidatus Lokiarchaeota archaeon]
MTLNSNQENVLSKASTNAVKENFARVIVNFNSNRWLRIKNRYAVDTIQKIHNDTFEGAKNYKNKEINEYIAASIILHCMDAWSYFGRAIGSLLNGDTKISRHLLYYSELRSGMSILASQGIGVFNNKHFIIHSRDRCKILTKLRTHDFVWLALNFWIDNLNASSILRETISLEEKSLDIWLDLFGIRSGTKDSILKKFLLSIGFDLQLFNNDHNARDEVSYRPTTIIGTSATNYKQILNEVKVCWQLCEPNLRFGLQRIDQLLLKRLLHITFKATHPDGRSHKQNSREFKNKINNMLIDLGLSNERTNWWQSYFEYDSSSEKVFSFIDGSKNIKEDKYVFGMLYRALLLLRISSAFCEEYTRDNSSLTKSDLDFWWPNIGSNSGLWGAFDDVSYFSDLWEDINLEIENLDLWISREDGEISQFGFQNDNHVSTLRLASFERACLWSLGI